MTLRLLFALSCSTAAFSADAPADDPMAQDQAGVIPGIAPGVPPPIEQVPVLAYEIGSKIRCPVCQGLSVADSSSPAAVQMQRRIRDLVAAGYLEDDIVDYFVERYGEFLLLEPRMSDRRNLMIWAGPGLVLGLALALGIRTLFVWRKPEAGNIAAEPAADAPKDEFERRLLAELED